MNPDPVRRARAAEVLARCRRRIRVASRVMETAARLQDEGFGGYDAIHLACGIQAEVEAFVTTDDRLVRLATRHAGVVRIRLVNPVDLARA